MWLPDNFPKYGWIKYFDDKTTEVGSDEDVQAGKASWRNGRQKGMIGCSIHVDTTSAFLFADTSGTQFWQSDDYESSMSNQAVKRITRRIQQKISDHEWKTIEIDVESRTMKELILKHKV